MLGGGCSARGRGPNAVGQKMRTAGKLFISIAGSFMVIAAASAASAAPAEGARQSMERCVSSVLSRLARAQAPESDVGPAVLSKCDGQLRATLAEAIRSGEAAVCSVESCIGIARTRASEEATQAYREIKGRRAAR